MGKSDRSEQSHAERHNKHSSELRRHEVVDVCGQHSQNTEISKSRKRQRTVEIAEERMDEEKKHKKGKKKHKKEKKKHKKEKKKHKKEKKKQRESVKCGLETSPSSFGPLPPESQNLSESNDLIGRRMAPMTKEQWERQRSTIRHVYDPETGRNRLVRGSGEILEEIVSKKRHTEINKQATTGDGIFYQYTAGLLNR